MPPVSITQARRAKAQLQALLAGEKDVVGIGLTKQDGGYALKLNLRRAGATGRVPSSVDGVPVVSEVVGTIRKR
jgi:hypothetical protein